MQTFYLHKKILKLYALVIPEKSVNEHEKLCQDTVSKWKTLKEKGMKSVEIQLFLGISQSTYYRRKNFLKNPYLKSKAPKNPRKSKFGTDIFNKILKIRHENPTYGKAKITPILRRDFDVDISESSVGRILTSLKVSKSLSAIRLKKRRKFTKHAKPWQFKKYSEMEIGENVQIDHMTVTKNDVTMKHFGSWERHTKHVYSNVYSNAKSRSARKFLEELISKIPYKIKSIQVDGGSEFMNEFEDACAEFQIPLFVLPPAKPTYNGGVERSNRMFREEFYGDPKIQEYSLCGFRRELFKFLEKYNDYRPHFALKGLTPNEYTKIVLEANNFSQNI
jgi:transposase InsO family protein